MEKEELSVEECKKIQLKLLSLIDEICKKNNIKYFLAYGTLIGAVRHKGFIPWDDDIDVYMSRKDYETFLEIMRKNNYENCLLLDSSNENYYYPFAKIVDSTTMAKMEDNTTQHGIWIDIFPIDKIPFEKKKSLKYRKKCIFWRDLIIAMTTDFSIGKEKIKHYEIKRVLSVFAKIIGKRRVLSICEKLNKKYLNEDLYKLSCLSSPYVLKEDFTDEILFTPDEFEFENCRYCGPKNYDVYLKTIYGDYMKLPPEEKRTTHRMKVWRV